MLTVAGWIIFAVGLAVMLAGVVLIVYGATTKRVRVGTESAAITPDLIAAIANAIIGILKVLFDNIEPHLSKAGLILVVIGLVLIILPFFVPGLKA